MTTPQLSHVLTLLLPNAIVWACYVSRNVFLVHFSLKYKLQFVHQSDWRRGEETGSDRLLALRTLGTSSDHFRNPPSDKFRNLSSDHFRNPSLDHFRSFQILISLPNQHCVDRRKTLHRKSVFTTRKLRNQDLDWCCYFNSDQTKH